jgi:hypothetical protein
LAWRRFFFVFGCNPSLHTVISNSADPGWHDAIAGRFAPSAWFESRHDPDK